MSKTVQSPRKGKALHELKGPIALTPAEIKDIVESRKIPDARTKLAKRYGISQNRVTKVWTYYYGGPKLSDCETGLKRELPLCDIDNKALRRYKSDRAEYIAEEPKTTNRATPIRTVRRVHKIPAKEHDLDLSKIDEISNEDAEIIAGEVENGNNSAELINTINELIQSNTHLSKTALKSLKQAQLYAKKNYRSSDIESEYETDDSTIAYNSSRARYTDRDTIAEDGDGDWDYPEERVPVRNVGPSVPYGDYEGYTGRYNGDSSAMATRPSTNKRLDGLVENNKGNELGPTGHRARAQPVYRAIPERPTPGPESCNIGQDTGYEQEVPNTKQNRSQAAVQSNYACDYNKQYSQPGARGNIYSPGGAGPSQTVQGISWLKPRK